MLSRLPPAEVTAPSALPVNAPILIPLETPPPCLTPWQQFLHRSAYVLSCIRALSCGITTAGSFLALHLVTGGLAGLIALLLCISGTVVNWWLLKPCVSSVLIDLFGKEKFFVDEEGAPLNFGQKLAMGLALVVSLAAGISFAAVAYGSTFHLVAGFPFLAVFAPVLPYLAVILFGVSLICMTALMLKDIAVLIKKKNPLDEIRAFLKNLIYPKELNPKEFHSRILTQRVLTIILNLLFLPLTCLGLYMTMKACAPNVQALLLKLAPALAAKTAELITTSICLVLALISRIPFGLKITMQTITAAVPSISRFIMKIFCPSQAEPVAESHSRATPQTKIWRAFELISVILNAIGNGFLAMKGAEDSTLSYFALIGGTENSFFAGFFSILKPRPTGPRVPQEGSSHAPSSTLTMFRTDQLKPQAKLVSSKDDFYIPASLGTTTRTHLAWSFQKSSARKQEQPVGTKDDISLFLKTTSCPQI